ncbi:MAG: type I restriction-modification system subunit M [Candidatus Cloacimonetes bacterium]|nr:type I restriction-modification system subunit M [Candidatus Cloacimonadota bacterium]
MALKKSELYSDIWKACDQLRGGMDASQYKDYILVLLFVKYVSDKYGKESDPFSPIKIPKGKEPGEGGSFGDMLFYAGKDDIGDQINKIIGRLAEANGLKGVIDITDFNDKTKLGDGKAMVDRLSGLLGIFNKPEFDFSNNRAEGDDLLGDAYEYLMKNFAVQSGKSKGQFYTPAEVSRIMSKVLGINKADNTTQSVYDPTCGSGSLLIKAANEAPIAISVFGQEIDISMTGLAKMNMILHGITTAEIHQGNTLSSPQFKKDENSLLTFDFAVANPPFSTKNWRNGFNPEQDIYNRFDSFGIPPEKNGDYAFLLHLVKSLKSTGKGAIILPHGVLFRGGAEAEIRKNLIERKYIKGIIGLPANLFYGTPIPACIIVIDKEEDQNRDFVFYIDASKDFAKDGNKNRLREQDIHKIVDAFGKFSEIEKYSRKVKYSEIKKNEYNLNIPRYIDNNLSEDLQDIEAHLKGGIPARDIEALKQYWQVLPDLKDTLFSPLQREGYLKLNILPIELSSHILENKQFNTFKSEWMQKLNNWENACTERLKQIKPADKPKEIIHDISEKLLALFKSNPLIDAYDVYQILMQYWADTMQDDIYQIVAEGWQADKEMLPAELIIKRYFASEDQTINALEEQIESLTQQMKELAAESESEENDPLESTRNNKGKITKALLTDSIKALKQTKDSEAELQILTKYLKLLDAETESKSVLKQAKKSLDGLIDKKYKSLNEVEIKSLIVEDKWLATVKSEVQGALELISHRLASRIIELAERYAEPLPEIEAEVAALSAKVEAHLQRMGFSWK